MTEEQAAKMISLLESIDARLKTLLEDDDTYFNVYVQNRVEVEGTVCTYESRG